MITLINQLEEELQELFSNREDSYKKTIVKQKYKALPKGYYPKVIIEEIENSEVSSRTTTEGEKTTNLAYQITVYCRDTEEHEAIDAVRFILDLIDNYLKPPTYNIKRVGDVAIMPFISDDTIKMGALRYSCVYDYETNLIYRD